MYFGEQPKEIIRMPTCFRCSKSVSPTAEEVCRQSGSRYPLLCESCLLLEMDLRIAERRFCESCGSPLSFYRRFIMMQRKRQGTTPLRLCLTCLRKKLDSERERATSDARLGPQITEHKTSEHEPEPMIDTQTGEIRWACSKCLRLLSTASIERFTTGRPVHCEHCGIWMKSEQFTP